MKQRTYFASYSRRVARGVPVRLDDLLVVEGRMGGEVLATNLVALQGQREEVNTELAWETTRRALQQHRLQRTPIKLQVRVISRLSHVRRSWMASTAAYVSLQMSAYHVLCGPFL